MDSTTPDQNELECDGNEALLHILQSSRTGASPSNGLVSYPRQYPSAEMQSVYSKAQVYWAGKEFDDQYT